MIHKNIGYVDWFLRFILMLVFIWLAVYISKWFYLLVLWEIFVLTTRWCFVYDLLKVNTLKNKFQKNRKK